MKHKLIKAINMFKNYIIGKKQQNLWKFNQKENEKGISYSKK